MNWKGCGRRRANFRPITLPDSKWWRVPWTPGGLDSRSPDWDMNMEPPDSELSTWQPHDGCELELDKRWLKILKDRSTKYLQNKNEGNRGTEGRKDGTSWNTLRVSLRPFPRARTLNNSLTLVLASRSTEVNFQRKWRFLGTSVSNTKGRGPEKGRRSSASAVVNEVGHRAVLNAQWVMDNSNTWWPLDCHNRLFREPAFTA